MIGWTWKRRASTNGRKAMVCTCRRKWEGDLLDEMTKVPLDRRALLRSAIMLVGGAVAAKPAMALVQAAAAAPRFFTAEEFALLDEVAAIMIPKTDTPGAREAGVPGYVDALMSDWAAPVTAQKIRDVLGRIDAAAQSGFGGPLLALPAERRFAAVEAFDAEAMASDREYRRLKELVLLTYYLSEVGATQELRYELVPGAWEASIPLKPGQPAWAA